MKSDERELMLGVATCERPETARDVAARLKMHPNRAEYLLQKWQQKGWWEYGVSLSLGWFTDAGKAEVAALKLGKDIRGGGDGL